MHIVLDRKAAGQSPDASAVKHQSSVGLSDARARWEGDDEDDDDADDEADDQEGEGDEDEDDDGARSVAKAGAEADQAQRSLIDAVLQKVADRGFDLDDVAEQAGVAGPDAQTLTRRDLAVLTQFLAQHFPETIEALQHRYPAAEGLLDDLSGDGHGDLFGGIGRLFR
jgi:hypothetical protein